MESRNSAILAGVYPHPPESGEYYSRILRRCCTSPCRSAGDSGIPKCASLRPWAVFPRLRSCILAEPHMILCCASTVAISASVDSSALRIPRQQMREYMVLLQCTDTTDTCGKTTMHQNVPSRCQYVTEGDACRYSNLPSEMSATNPEINSNMQF